MARRKGKRRSANTQYQRARARDERTIAAKRRLRDALRKKAQLIKAIRAQDKKREAIFQQRKAARARQAEYDAYNRSIADRKRVADAAKTKQLAKTKTRRVSGVAARSARTQYAPRDDTTHKRLTSSWLSPSKLAALNKRRKHTRNKWKDDDCVQRPDPKKAAEVRHSGKGGQPQKPRRWC